MIPEGKITLHFSWAEARCRCGECDGWGDAAVQAEIRRTAEWAEKVRAALGDAPMRVNSWYRCPAHNAAVGGVSNSQHLLGRAIDFAMRDRTPAAVQRLLRRQWPHLVRGLGQYAGFTHIDRRESEPATWRG